MNLQALTYKITKKGLHRRYVQLKCAKDLLVNTL